MRGTIQTQASLLRGRLGGDTHHFDLPRQTVFTPFSIKFFSLCSQTSVGNQVKPKTIQENLRLGRALVDAARDGLLPEISKNKHSPATC